MDLAKETGWEALTDSTQEAERLRRWAEAYTAWREGLQAHYSQNVWKDAHHAWKEFNAWVQKPPWEVMAEEGGRYQAMLSERGLKVKTIRTRMVNLQRLYDYCIQEGVDEEVTRRGNPFAQVELPKVVSYEKPTYLLPADERKLLRTIRRDPSVIGQRDYALFLMLLSTGRRAGEVRRLQWRDLVFAEEQTWLVEKGSGKRMILLTAVGEAIENWLRASGRLEAMEAEDYVFAPSKEPLVQEAGNQAEDWRWERPLSMDEVNYLLKLYAGWAGLNEAEVTCHTLRNSAALRKQESGESIEAIQASMGRKEAVETRKYLKKLSQNGRPVGHSRKRIIRKKDEMPTRKPGRAQPGNRLNLWHGYYAKYPLPEMVWFLPTGKHLDETDFAIVGLRLILRRIAILSGYATSLEEMIILLRLTTKTANKISLLIYRRWRMRTGYRGGSGIVRRRYRP